MSDRRADSGGDRRANPRSGRRDGDQRTAWYLRRPLWLAAASLAFVSWRRLRAYIRPRA